VGLWWRGRRNEREWDDWRYIATLTLKELRAMRTTITRVWHDSGGTTIGFVPRTFAVSIATKHGLRMPKGLDGILMSYALYLPIQVAEGSYEDGPPTDSVLYLGTAYADKPFVRRQRLKRSS
jgi:hypothetical protein